MDRTIEETLTASPGMRETHRAFAKEMVIERRIEELCKQRAEAGADDEAIQKIEAELSMLRRSLENATAEITRCQEAEKVLKAKMQFVG
jgi:hypothetical protein